MDDQPHWGVFCNGEKPDGTMLRKGRRHTGHIDCVVISFMEINMWSRFLLNMDCISCFSQRGDSAPNFNNGGPDGKDMDIVVTYTNAFGNFQINRVKMSQLSSSWIFESPTNEGSDSPKQSKTPRDLYKDGKGLEENVDRHGVDNHSDEDGPVYPKMTSMSPMKLKRKMLRQRRRELRTAELIREDKVNIDKVQATRFEPSETFEPGVGVKRSIWRRDFESLKSDFTLKLLRDQISLAKAYAQVAKSKNESSLYSSIMKQCIESQRAIGEANSDAELHPSALNQTIAIGRLLSIAKNQLYDCPTVQRKFQGMIQSTEDNVHDLNKKSSFLIQLAAKVVPRPLHCLALQLATDYFLKDHTKIKDLNPEKFVDPSLYHYAIFSDNILATSVVINSTMLHTKELQKHVFHIVTDKLNFAAMKMWFLVNSPKEVTVQVENIDDFKWLNSSYCSVLRQLESERLQEYYFKANHPSSLSGGPDNLKYRNPKYLSMLNHLRFYLPEVETCKGGFHRFDKYLNFSNPKIYEHFARDACGWAFGMNIFDLKEWRKRNLTAIYHCWQDQNENRNLWKLGSLPPGLITFYNQTYALERKWHVLGLGYDRALNKTEIENGAVIHYNGNLKPWLDLAITKYQSYWSKHVMFDNYYLQLCSIRE
ncbi:hypothetical protein Patl1_03182 [Pistacia atlantica]|uniref:Uncharacterized protein n=1 Tax=Pistacia atlantica TaxID=434234 RepID=A0ACC1CC95_9ROSI|nr:hypothetical protein Patl1_03182 [Pistacia atlantica]